MKKILLMFGFLVITGVVTAVIAAGCSTSPNSSSSSSTNSSSSAVSSSGGLSSSSGNSSNPGSSSASSSSSSVNSSNNPSSVSPGSSSGSSVNADASNLIGTWNITSLLPDMSVLIANMTLADITNYIPGFQGSITPISNALTGTVTFNGSIVSNYYNIYFSAHVNITAPANYVTNMIFSTNLIIATTTNYTINTSAKTFSTSGITFYYNFISNNKINFWQTLIISAYAPTNLTLTKIP